MFNFKAREGLKKRFNVVNGHFKRDSDEKMRFFVAGIFCWAGE
jgi:hypothetical protein